MNGSQIRDTFLRFFEERGHTVVTSSSLIPRNDPTLFFTNAGMVQFKNVFTGEEKREYVRAGSVQKCLRVSGKHNDLENVGVTPRHHTFFEMLGNFSFGDYFKRDAILYAWDLLTKVYGLDPAKLWITIFRDDDEAFELWVKEAGVKPERVVRLGEKDNFWSMGDTGPCGPCSEIHIDIQAHAGGPLNLKGPAEDPEGYLEIWNLVFMQFERHADGRMTPLPRPSIDTGMGLERLAAVLQGKQSNYDTDLFRPIIDHVAQACGIAYNQDPAKDISMRVIADHARATAMLVADGVIPSNEDRGYVLRRIMRRAIRHGVKLELQPGFLAQAVGVVVAELGKAFPELQERRSYLDEVVRNEELRFAETLDRGLRLYRQKAASLLEAGEKVLPGAFAFLLSDTYGFPLDLTQIIAGEDGLVVDEAGFQIARAAQQERSRAGWQGSGEEAIGQVFQAVKRRGVTTRFLGYTQQEAQSPVLALIKAGQEVTQAEAGDEVEVMAAETPFYGESGGQLGDTGLITSAAGLKIQVEDTQVPLEGLYVMRGKVLEGTIQVGEPVLLSVDDKRRAAIRRNHTATHLLHAALRKVLGTHVVQRGSLVAPDRLRFDFLHFKAMSHEEIRQVEDEVNQGVLANIGVETDLKNLADAMAAGVMALFGEKYGDEVRVVQVPGVSAELCGGTHVGRTGDIGFFKVVSEGGIQAGVRRVEAVTGTGALEHARAQEDKLKELAEVLGVGLPEVARKVNRLLEERKDLEKQLEAAQRKAADLKSASDLQSRMREIHGVKVVSLRIDADMNQLREQADRLRDKLQSAIIVLGSGAGGKPALLVAVTKDLVGRYHAGNLVKELSKRIEGSGGGRPDFAQAGGKNLEALPEALEAVYTVVEALHA